MLFRSEILKNQGITEVEVSVVSLSLEREKALNVTLNNSQVGSDWDADKLVDLLGELEALEDFDATLTGFDSNDINDLLLGPDPSFQQQPEPEPASRVVRVVLEVPPADWEALRPQLDSFIAKHNLTVHIKLPSD